MKLLPPARRPTRAVLGAALLAALTAGTAACGSSSSSNHSSSASPSTTAATSSSDKAGGGSSSGGAAPAAGAKVPAGTVLKVAQQFYAEQLPIKLSGTKAIPSTVKVEWSNFTGGPQVVQALEANAIDLGELGDVPLAYTQVANKGIVAIAAIKSSGDTYGVVSAPGAGIKDVAGLKGKKVAYTQATGPQAFLLRALGTAGLSKSNVQLVNIATQSDVTAALTAHSIDAAALTEPLITEYLQKNPTATEIVKSSPATTTGMSYFVTTQAALKSPAKAAAIADFLKALVIGLKWENTHQSAWVKSYYVGQQQLTTALGDKVYKLSGANTFPTIGPALYSTQQKVIDALASNGFVPSGLQAAKEFDPRYNAVVQAAATS